MKLLDQVRQAIRVKHYLLWHGPPTVSRTAAQRLRWVIGVISYCYRNAVTALAPPSRAVSNLRVNCREPFSSSHYADSDATPSG